MNVNHFQRVLSLQKQSVHSGMKNLVTDLPNNEALNHEEEMNERKIIHQVDTVRSKK